MTTPQPSTAWADDVKQDSRVQEAIDEALRVGLGLLPDEVEVAAKFAISYALKAALKILGIETGKVIVEAGPDAKIKIRIGR